MKKIICFVLVIIMCASMCACGGDVSEQSAPIESVDIDTLLSALDNQAKAEMYIGKGTEMYVTIITIYSDYCEVRHLFNNAISKIYMPKEELAQLKKGEYMTFFAVVDTVESNDSSFIYTFKNAEIKDMVAFDEYYENAMSYRITGLNRYDFFDNYESNSNNIIAHVKKRGSALYVSKDDIANYLVGTWERQIEQPFFERHSSNKVSFYGTHTPEITFLSDGTYEEQYYGGKTTKSEFYDGDYSISTGTWNAAEGGSVYISGFCHFEWGLPLYRVNDDMLVYNDVVYLRVKQ